jgi:hypothetical protein
VRFAHDLIADWARMFELQSQGEAVADFITKHAYSPLWHRAIRYFGLGLLEGSSNYDAWQQLFHQFQGDGASFEIVQNLLLEAPNYALQQATILDRMWPLLIKDNGTLLRRFLRQFLIVATIPNENIVAHFRKHNPELQLEMAARFRLPWPYYWYDVLSFLHAHKADVVKFSREEVADICILWLPLHQIIQAGMEDAANLALASAQLFYSSGENPHSHHKSDPPEEKICRALLAAAPIKSNEVAELALKMCGRHLPTPEDAVPEKNEYTPSFLGKVGPPQPWTEGPRRRCLYAFREVFMDGNHSAPLIAVLPDVASEILFSVLLNIPRAGLPPREYYHHDIDEYGFDCGELRRESCFWTNGPFLTFLRLQPEIALSAIIRLVNFATDRGVEVRADQKVEILLKIDGKERIWRGHQFSYLWHQGHIFGPQAANCALLSLEKWLYLLIDEGKSIDRYLLKILEDSRSVALAAVLVCVGKRVPELFLGPLRPLFGSLHLYWIEEQLRMRMEDNFRSASISMDVRMEEMRKAWHEWINFPHRKETLGQLVLRKLINEEKWRESFAPIHADWKAEVAADNNETIPLAVLRFIEQFDLKNYSAEARGDGFVVRFEPPASLPPPSPDVLERMARYEKLSLLPFQCRQILMGEAQCSEEQIAAWWKELTEVRKIVVPEDERGIRNIEDALCGIVAVAIVHHRKWLAADPCREAEAVKILREVMENPPSRSLFFHEDDIGDYKWDVFAAWAITTLWAERPDDSFLRQAVAAFVLYERYLIVERTMRVAAQHRLQLGDHFSQLFAHAVRFAPARHFAMMEKYSETKTFNLETWLEKHIAAFIHNKTEPLPASWIELAQPQPLQGRNRTRATGGFDIGQLNALLAWTDDFNKIVDKNERTYWLNLHREALLTAISRMEKLGNAEDDDNTHPDYGRDHWPYKSEERMLQRIAYIVANLSPGETHNSLWEPILGLGVKGHRWVGSFCSRWLIDAACKDKVAPAFIEQWVAMLHFAENCQAWQLNGSRPWDLQEMWKDLFGLSPFGADFWREELAPAVEAARPYFERWAKRSISDDNHACSFLYFLRTPAAKCLRLLS